MKIFFLIIVLMIYSFFEIKFYKIENIKLCSKKINSDIKIVQISDFHSSKYVDIEKLILDIKNYKPDLIFLTGDIIDRRTTDYNIVNKFINSLSTLDIPIYFIFGNHELKNRYKTKFIEILESYNINILENEIEFIYRFNIEIAGIKFGLTNEEYDNLVNKFSNDRYNILLSHSPKYPVNYHSNREDLILSGHTHGGQVRLPLIGAVVSSGEGLFPKYDKGLFELKDSILYIDSGLGTTALPIRFLCKSQISFIEIVKINN